MNKIPIVFVLCFVFRIAFCQNVEINVGNGKYIIDENMQLIVCNKDIAEYDSLSGVELLTLNLNGNECEFSYVPGELEYGEPYSIFFSSQTFRVYFSQLPLINFNTTQEIADEPKVLATMTLTDVSNSEIIESFCGIEYRGGFTQSYPKRSYDLELWENETGEESRNITFLNMRNDDDWMLIAMYNEPLRIRSTLAHSLWNTIHQLYYISEEEDALPGLRTQYAEGCSLVLR